LALKEDSVCTAGAWPFLEEAEGAHERTIVRAPIDGVVIAARSIPPSGGGRIGDDIWAEVAEGRLVPVDARNRTELIAGDLREGEPVVVGLAKPRGQP
jgi:hypothetical protein